MTEQEMNEHIEEQAPAWFDTNYCTRYDIAAIQQGGCASGAYMPAVTYYTAKQIMNEYGDDVLECIYEALGEIPAPPDDTGWSGVAVHYLSLAVELWASQFDLDDVDDDCPDCIEARKEERNDSVQCGDCYTWNTDPRIG